MIPNSYSSRRNSQRLTQDRASSSSTSSSQSPQSLDEALPAVARSTARTSRSSSRTSRTSRASRASRGTNNSSSYPGVIYSRGGWSTVNGGSFSTQEEAAWALNRDRAERGLPLIRFRRASQPSSVEDQSVRQDAASSMTRPTHTDAVQINRMPHPTMASQNTSRVSSRAFNGIDTDGRSFYQDVASYMTSPTYEDAIQMPTPTASQNTSRVSSRAFNGIDTDDRSFYQDAASYMASPTYIGAVRTGNSSSLEQLSLARSLIGRGGDSLWGQLDDEYRGQERGPHSPT